MTTTTTTTNTDMTTSYVCVCLTIGSKCHAIIGYTVIGNQSLLCVATKVSLDLVLPPNHKVFCVQDSKWLKINLAYPMAHQSKFELKNIDVLQVYPINGLHYYSETYDLTRQFPSTFTVDDYDAEFCWNEEITKEFKVLGMRRWCCVLMQGIAKENVVLDVTTPSMCFLMIELCVFMLVYHCEGH